MYYDEVIDVRGLYLRGTRKPCGENLSNLVEQGAFRST